MVDEPSDAPRVQFVKTSEEPLHEGTVRGKHTVLVDERTGAHRWGLAKTSIRHRSITCSSRWSTAR